MSKLLYASPMGRVSVDADGNFTTIGSTRTLVCEMAIQLKQMRDALEEIASFSPVGAHGEKINEVEIAKDALKALTTTT